MKKKLLISIIFLLGFVNAYSQYGSPNIRRALLKIKTAPYWYSPGYTDQTQKIDKKVDSVYNRIIKLDTNAIIKLMDFLPDTSLTKIKNPCNKGFLTFSELAFFLINDIENVPLSITNLQWDSFGECGTIPNSFLEYLKNNGTSFEKQYRNYFNSKQRQEYIKRKT